MSVSFGHLIDGAVGALKRGGMLLGLINSGSFLC